MERVRKLVNANTVYAKGYTGRKIRIALLDTGVAEHKDLQGRIAVFCDFINGKTRPYDDNGHGTHIAGILCGDGSCSRGRWAGMAPRAELVVLKILDEKGNGSTAIALQALEWIKRHKDEYNIRLMNFSIGYLPGVNMGDQKKLLEMIDELWDMDLMIVTAAGNNGPGIKTVTVPGISRKVVTVGASDDRIYNSSYLKSGYSGSGPTACCIVKPEILAPGTNIRSLSHIKDGYAIKSGTSMAAPVVCGALALAFEKDPYLTPALLKLQLYESVSRKKVENHRRCWGILDVDNLIDMI